MTRRALLLAAGGLKIAFQAGVVQVWLDEVQVPFDHVDAVSAATFNLAMLCNGSSGSEVAENWRRFRPLRAVAPSWSGLAAGPFGASLLTLDRLRQNVFPAWGLDFATIRSSSLSAGFNVFDVTTQSVEVRSAAELTEDVLLAAAALPRWFPPVVVDGHVYVDAVHATPANVADVLARGIDELWVVWTTSTEGRWRPGAVPQYFQAFEEAANARMRAALADIRLNNERFAADGCSTYGRHVEVRLLQAEVPLHYLLNFDRRRFPAAVELGVAAARDWCREQGVG